MSDLDIAASRLKAEDLSLIFVKEGRVVYQSGHNGMKPFIDAIQTSRQNLEGSSIADKLVGRAAALLAVYVKVHSVYASVIGLEAAKLLEQHSIPCSYGRVVERVMNRAGTDICPFEKAVFDTDDPVEAYERIKEVVYPPLAGQ